MTIQDETFGSMLVTIPIAGMNGLMACLPAASEAFGEHPSENIY
jgi:hypothetical protein